MCWICRRSTKADGCCRRHTLANEVSVPLEDLVVPSLWPVAIALPNLIDDAVTFTVRK